MQFYQSHTSATRPNRVFVFLPVFNGSSSLQSVLLLNYFARLSDVSYDNLSGENIPFILYSSLYKVAWKGCLYCIQENWSDDFNTLL